MTPPLNQKFSATPKICLKLCSSSKTVDFTTFLKSLIKILNFYLYHRSFDFLWGLVGLVLFNIGSSDFRHPPFFQGLSTGIVFKHFFSERSKVQMSLHTVSKIIAGNVFFSLGLNYLNTQTLSSCSQNSLSHQTYQIKEDKNICTDIHIFTYRAALCRVFSG